MKKYLFTCICSLVFLSLNVQALELPSWLDSSDEPEMSIESAQALIAKQQDLQTIPKQTWKLMLDDEQYKILWRQGTERAFTGALLGEKRQGVYVTAGCKLPVFSSSHKFKSGTGWPSFWDVLNTENVVLKEDRSWGMRRTEVLSACGEHLGHVFEDGPNPTGLRYCINSKALLFIPDEDVPLP